MSQKFFLLLILACIAYIGVPMAQSSYPAPAPGSSAAPAPAPTVIYSENSEGNSAGTVESPIDSYSVVLYGKDQTGGNLVGFIHCYNKGKNVMTCEFYEDGTVLPENRNKGGRVGLAYHWSHFKAVLDLLRNEKPVFFAFIESTKVGYVATGTSTSSHLTENVGEGEH